nr:hypothetical protein [uncultured Acetatifactor sp.]
MSTEHMKERRRIGMAEAAFLAGIWILLACFFDYRYAMNDDVLIHGILSGKYAGTPDIHNISMNIVLNGVFVLLYRLCGFVPWFGLMMVSAQFCSLYEIVMCLERKMQFRAVWRHVFLGAANLLLTGLMLRELVIVQYTYTAALLMAAATARLFCMEEAAALGRRFWQYFGILIQYLLVFCLRTEMCLFLLPFAGVLTVIAYHKRNGLHILRRELLRWGLFWGALFVCLTGLYAADHAGYAQGGWADYRKVDQYRTQLYDFLALPAYKENQDFYEAAGISEIQYELLKNYNFSLDQRITGDTLQRVVEYANEKRMAQYQGAEKLYMRFFTLPLREGIWSYSHRVLFDPEVSGDDYPWNFVCAALYLTMIILTFLTKRWRNAVYLFLLGAVRSVLWMYLILRQRAPARVTHGLFVMEIVCLLVLVFEELSALEKNTGSGKYAWLYGGLAILFLGGAGAVTADSWAGFPGEYRNTVAFHEGWQELLQYCSWRKDCFYLFDVYSTVNYSEPIFGDAREGPDNYDICGGWLAKSPLCTEKYENFGFGEPLEALIEKDNVFFMAQEGSDLEWLLGLYEEQGVRAEAEYLDRVAGQFDIIRLRPVVEEAGD